MEASPEIEEKVEKLLQQMTLAEKIGQLNQSNANGVATGPQKAQDDFYKQLEAGRIGSILNIVLPAFGDSCWVSIAQPL